jgi:hypothetical protein
MTGGGALDFVTDDLPSGTWPRIEGGVQCASLVRREYPSGCDLDCARKSEHLVRCRIATTLLSTDMEG